MGGEYSVTRYKMTRENCLQMVESAGHSSGKRPAREFLQNRLNAMAAVEYDMLNGADTISIRADLTGFSWELILIDKKTAS